MSATHDFARSRQGGKQGERYLDAFYRSLGISIYEARLEDEKRLGFDRIFVEPPPQARAFTVDYKTDFWRTGKVAIEVLSDVERNVPGWVYKYPSFVIYWLVQYSLALTLKPVALRESVDAWTRQHRVVDVQNDGYRTRCVLVPIGVVSVAPYCVIKNTVTWPTGVPIPETGRAS